MSLTIRWMKYLTMCIQLICRNTQGIGVSYGSLLVPICHGHRASATNKGEDVGRTKFAETVAKRHWAVKHRTLQTGGLIVAEGRRMVQRREDVDLTAGKVPSLAAELRGCNGYKQWFEAAAKGARKWMTSGKLEPTAVYGTGCICRLLKRFQ